MTTRELWQNIMFYRGHDRVPVIHWWEWPETRERWFEEGFPRDVSDHVVFHTQPHWAWVGVHLDLFPAFERQLLDETDDYRIVRGHDGVVQQEWKNQSCIPHFIDFTLKTAADWPEFKRRLQPDPQRISPDLDKNIAAAESSGLPVSIGTASMMGWIRNWMGVENMSYLMFDDPDVYADMVNTLADLTCWGIDQVAPRMKGPPDLGFGWEDIAGKNGPLVGPGIFERCVASGYRKIRAKLEQYGTKLLGIDSDGDVRPLLAHWLEAGVNVQFPIEVGTWKADGMALRQQYGRELRIIGHFNKLVLEKDPTAIDAEIERLRPLLQDGGFVMMPDHLITPGTPLANYRYYIESVRCLRL